MKKKIPVNEQLDAENIADLMEAEDLNSVGSAAWDGFNTDEVSRTEWKKRNADYIKLASQVRETRSFPWKNSSNVKYPLLAIASLQFCARAHVQLFPGPNIVKGRVIGEDGQGLKRAAADRISKHMSYQLMEEMEGWEDDMDRLNLILPICGNVFKKTFRNGDKNKSELILPQDLVINYYAQSIDPASRKTHILNYYPNEIEEKFRSGEWIRPTNSFGDAIVRPIEGMEISGNKIPQSDPDAPHQFLEQHSFYDLDGDGYKEPVIITLHGDSKQVVKIVARYEPEGVEFDERGEEVIKITPVEYFTNFIFIPDVTSGVYGQGFGSLLGPLNETSNSIINNLVDAATLSNLPAGFLARGTRSPQRGVVPLAPGEFRPLQVPGDDVRKAIFPLQFKEPSPVLLQLLGMMLESGQSLSSVSDMMTGKSPGQNQPYSTTSDVMQQGLQVFSSIYRRIHRSLKHEYRKLFALNKKYVSDTEYFMILDSDPQEQGVVTQNDYLNESMDVIPASDPTIISNMEKQQKAESLVAFMQMGTINPIEGTRRILEARGVEDINKLMEMPPPQPDPKIVLEQKKLELEEKRLAGDQQFESMKQQFNAMRNEASAQKSIAQAQAEQQRVDIERLKAESQAIKDAHALELQKQQLEFQNMELKMNSMVEMYKADKQAESKRRSAE